MNDVDRAEAAPRRIEGPQAWYGPQMAARSDWIHALAPADVDEIDRAVSHAIARGAGLVDLTADDFPLPTLGARIRAVRDDVLHGRGFALVRALPVERWPLERSAFAFRGLGAHFGEAVSQNGKGHVLGHVTNLGLDYADPTTRGYQTASELRFHTDGGDVVALLCLKPSRSGGKSRIASSTTVWNEIVTRRPDLALELGREFCFSRWGEIPAGQARYAKYPLFAECEGRMIASFVMSSIEKAQAFPEVPRLTGAQREALAMVNDLAGDDALRLDMDFRPGDLQFVSNHSILHSRTAYEDWPEIERRRHLLRLWLACPSGPALPAHSTTAFQGATASGRPNGIVVPGVSRKASLIAD